MGNDLGMQYIMDGTGNYYAVNGDDQLVVVKDRDAASVFTIFEANQRIGAGKKSKFYFTVPVGDIEEVKEAQEVSAPESIANIYSFTDIVANPEIDVKENAEPIKVKAAPTFEYDIEQVDWKEFVNYFIFVANGAKVYQDELTKRLSEVDKEICDILHYVELYDLSDEESVKAMDMLKDARQRRRDVKNETVSVESFQRMLGTSANVAKARGCLTELEKLETKKYFPRLLDGLFVGMEDRKTDRDSFRMNRYQMNADVDEDTDDYVYEEEGQEMSFVETIFDNRENDWVAFARQQMEFYQNAGQYMINLKIAIANIDTAIEELMEDVEDANYNVTQGYKVFKELKDLRNERKEKVRELNMLRTMTDCFDMDAMAEAYSDNMKELAVTLNHDIVYDDATVEAV